MKSLNQLNEYMEIAGGWEISRRYTVVNGFDGILTVMAVILSSYFLAVDEVRFVLATGFAAAGAIGISGIWIAYLTEEAEQIRNKKELEKKIFTDLSNTVITKSARVASVINSFINGASPFLFGLLSLIPFLLVNPLEIDIQIAYYTSFVISGSLLFVLGIFLGRISQQSGLIMGMKTIFAGILVGLLTILIE